MCNSTQHDIIFHINLGPGTGHQLDPVPTYMIATNLRHGNMACGWWHAWHPFRWVQTSRQISLCASYCVSQVSLCWLGEWISGWLSGTAYQMFLGSAYSVGDLSRWTLRFYIAHGSLPTENRSVHLSMLRAIDAPNTMSHFRATCPRCTAILQIWLPNVTRRLPATYTPQLRLWCILVCTNISGMEAQPPT